MPKTASKKKNSFDSFPYGIKCKIQSKFTYKQFALFNECSQSSHSFCQSRPSVKFAYWTPNLKITKNKLSRGKTKENLIDVATSQVWYLTDYLAFEDPLTTELCNFVLQNIKPKSIGLAWKTKESLQNLNYFKAMNLQSIVIDSAGDEDIFCSDYSNVDNVYINEALSLSTKTLFSIKSKKGVNLKNIRISAEHLLDQIKKWKDGLWSPNTNFHLTRIKGFDMNRFVEGMRRLNSSHRFIDGYSHFDWHLVRPGAEYFGLRIICISFDSIIVYPRYDKISTLKRQDDDFEDLMQKNGNFYLGHI